MKTIFKITAFLLFFAGSKTSCKELEENYPKEITFTEYSLKETSGRWKNIESGKVIVINSNEELKNYFDCPNVDCSEIDFSKNTLLFACGGTTNGVDRIDAGFMQSSVSKYIC